MGAIKDARDALVSDLAALGVPIHAAWPVTLTAPCVFVTPPQAEAYVRKGPTFAEHTVSVDLVLLVEHAAAEVALVALEDLIEAALINTADWALAGVDPPAPLTVTDSGAEYLGALVHLSKPIRLT